MGKVDQSPDQFELYKLYLAGIEKISDRRDRANAYFLQIQSAILALLGLVIEFSKAHQSLLLIGIALFGVIVSIIFWFLIRSYRQLNTGKFKVLHEMEDWLQIDIYKKEWCYLGEGKQPKKYWPFSHVEQWIPVVFGLAYTLVLISQIFCH